MKDTELFNIIGEIDEKYLNDSDYPPKIKKKKTIPVLSACVVSIAVAGFIIISPIFNKSETPVKPIEENTTKAGVYYPELQPENQTGEGFTDGGAEDVITEIYSDGETEIQIVEKTSDGYEPDESSNFVSASGGIFIPALPADKEIITNGEKITDEEARQYFESYGYGIITALGASGVNTQNAKFSEKGYCHVVYTGLEGEKLEVRENFRDYLLYAGDELVSIVTLIKENGVITDSPSFGGAWFSAYTDFLSEHKGEGLVYVYADNVELIITPDNVVYGTVLSSVDYNEYFEGLDNPYSVFYHPSAQYTP